MKPLRSLLATVIAFTGCFVAPNETPLGNHTGGGATGTAGGAASAGGGAQGGGSAGGAAGGAQATGGGATGGGAGGGSVAPLDGGALIASPPALPTPACGPLALSGSCPDGGRCVTFHRAGQSAQLVADLEAFPSDEAYAYPVGTAAGGLVFATHSSSQQNSRLYLARANGGLRELQATGPGLRLNVTGLADSPGYGFWYRGDLFTGTATTMSALMLAQSGPATVTSPNLTGQFSSNAVAVGSDYFVAMDDGVYSFYPAGGGQLAPSPAPVAGPERIVAIDADSSGVVFLTCPNEWTAACRLFELPRQQSVGRLLATFPALRGGIVRSVSVALAGPTVYVLGALALYRMPRAGGAVEAVFRGEPFPQYTGTLAGGSLKVIGQRLYLGAVCYFDFDVPGYGSVELDLTTLTARWLNLDPAWPFVPYVFDYGGAFNHTHWHTSDGIYVVR